jgi:hypothetical protein
MKSVLVHLYQLLLLCSFGYSLSTYRTSTAATNRGINLRIFEQCIIESGIFLKNEKGFVKELLCKGKSAFPGVALFNKSNYGCENDFVKAMGEYIKPILVKAQVAAFIILNTYLLTMMLSEYSEKNYVFTDSG